MKGDCLVSDTLIIAMPTHDSRAVVQTMLELMQVGREMGRSVMVVSSEASNIPRCRNLVLDRIRKYVSPPERPWVLWVDSDILIPPDSHRTIVEALTWAETHERCIAANYMMGNGVPVLMRSRDPEQAYHYTPAELEEMPTYAEVGMAGFGFVYLRQPLDYLFHADRVGEDVHFWWDYPDIRIYWAKQIRLGHKKSVLLMPEGTGLSPEPPDSSPVSQSNRQSRRAAQRAR